ncbi:protein-lysine N-methyltransferase EEF2KMT-like [Macrobrachium rosenbergii]|uniref:protein-lysine N-methyltransferase EEF2KMT-like n=1 Tax=Macrobrachium rosenbergii TaxID=79674 RepID=UPI0034D687A0
MGDLTAALCFLLTRAHFAGVPTTRALWSHVSFALDAAKDELSPQDLEGRVLGACVQHPLSNTAPRDPKHIVDVLRWLVGEWRERDWPVPQVLTSGSIEDPTDCPELCYKTYVGWGEGNASLIGDVGRGETSKGVTLLESSGGIVHHTTGLTTWGGAAVLANWVTDYPYLISGRRVLELGAGIGFTASVILTTSDGDHPPPEKYIATDCHHHVLSLLHHNLELNLRDSPMKRTELEAFQSTMGKLLVSEEVQPGQIMPWTPPSAHLRLSSGPPDLTDVTDTSWQNTTKRGTQVEVLQLDWRSPCRLPDVDVILAADVVYAHHLIPPLVALIKSILSGKKSKRTKSTRRRKSRGKDSINGREKEITEGREANGGVGSEEAFESVAADRVAYIACTRRSHETMALFLEEVAKQGLAHSLVYQATLDTDTFLFLYNETHMPVKIYRLSLPEEEMAPSR